MNSFTGDRGWDIRRLQLLPAGGRLIALIGAIAYLFGTPVPSTMAQQESGTANIPVFTEPGIGIRKPELTAIPRLRFLTTSDFPPFSFIGEGGQLAGFNIDLARAICEKLDVIAKCEVQAVDWTGLEPALAGGQGEAVIAGWPVNRRLRASFSFTDPYLKFPARFVVRTSERELELTPRALAGRRIGVAARSAHEAMLRDFFPLAQAVVYQRDSWLKADLAAGKIDAVFGDGMELSFWLAGKASNGCCTFAGGPYYSEEFLGHGLTIAVDKDNPVLLQAITYALQEIARDGKQAELYRRYFPYGFL